MSTICLWHRQKTITPFGFIESDTYRYTDQTSGIYFGTDIDIGRFLCCHQSILSVFLRGTLLYQIFSSALAMICKIFSSTLDPLLRNSNIAFSQSALSLINSTIRKVHLSFNDCLSITMLHYRAAPTSGLGCVKGGSANIF